MSMLLADAWPRRERFTQNRPAEGEVDRDSPRRRFSELHGHPEGDNMPSPGAVAANLYQGSRSEYLAQYVFSMFGTAALVPHEADYGLDLFCTRTRTERGRAEPYAYYAVQIKSTPDPWVFDGPGSVRWILEYPAPLLFCVVNKNAAEKVARFSVYQLIARFQAAIMPDQPPSLTLVPGEPGKTCPFTGCRELVSAQGGERW